ncbi:hypothetical protein F444_18811 [Phytophthora nicotianae P1976]|uniref:Uncharacterized protein n=1 Tax=Phytophthora nicotianae P1976 TaxID=1317066 RepID=A0A080ZA30_PHYNI|nr:hypothetical protein F444_18811 [Phytophthora nicotianae P1976]
MQLKYKNHIVDSEKTEHAWNLWLASRRGKTVKLVIYEYGLADTKTQDLETFLSACIRPEETDRADATAESSLRDLVQQLQAHWEHIFQAEAVVWRM